MNLLLIADDITTIGGAERVVVNLANAFSVMRFDSIYGGGNPQIEILSTKRNRQDIAYPLNPNIRVTYYDFPVHKDDIKAIKGQYKRLYAKSKVLLYKLRFLINLRFIKTAEVLQRRLNIAINKNQYDFVIDNTWANFYPFRKNTNTQYIKILHSSVALQRIHQPESFFVGLKAFDCLVYMTSQIDIWQRYHSNIKVIPNFLPTIPQVATNHSQKVVLSVGRMSSEKGFLRLLDIWKVVRDRISSLRGESMDSPKQSTNPKIDACFARLTNPLDCHDFATQNLAMTGRDSSLLCESNAHDSSLQNPTNHAPFSSLRESETNEAIHKNKESKIDCHESLRNSRNDGVKSDLNEWKLIIVGDGVLKSEIESKIRTLNLQDSVILKPFTKDIEREYLGASIYAMASHFEGFPMVLLESTAYGLAPISFDIATGPSDIIEHNKSGFLIPDNDLESYAEKLIALMSDESMRIAFGNEAKRIVSENFSKEVIMQKWREVFEGKLIH